LTSRGAAPQKTPAAAPARQRSALDLDAARRDAELFTAVPEMTNTSRVALDALVASLHVGQLDGGGVEARLGQAGTDQGHAGPNKVRTPSGLV